MVLDLTLVEFLASIGVSAIPRTVPGSQSRGGRLVLLSPRPNIADVLTRTQIDQIIPTFFRPRAGGRRGIFLVRSIADDLRYERRDGRNRVMLVFRRDAGPRP